MVGNTTLLFKDSTFVFTERGELFEGNGKWYVTANEKYIILKGASVLKANKGTSLDLRKEINMKLRIKGKDKLVSEEEVFMREKKRANVDLKTEQ